MLNAWRKAKEIKKCQAKEWYKDSPTRDMTNYTIWGIKRRNYKVNEEKDMKSHELDAIEDVKS